MRYFIFSLFVLILVSCKTKFKEDCKKSKIPLKIYPLDKQHWELQSIGDNKKPIFRFQATFIFEGDFCEKADSITKYIMSFMDTTGFALVDSKKTVLDILSCDFYKTDKNLNKKFVDNLGGNALDEYYRGEQIATFGYNKKRGEGGINFIKNGTLYAQMEFSKKAKYELGKIEYY